MLADYALRSEQRSVRCRTYIKRTGVDTGTCALDHAAAKHVGLRYAAITRDLRMRRPPPVARQRLRDLAAAVLRQHRGLEKPIRGICEAAP